MRSLGMRFRGIFRSRDPGKLNSWIDDAVNSGLVAIERFARVLHRDLDAVYNAIELPWSNGQAEGQINRRRQSSVQCMAELARSCSVHACWVRANAANDLGFWLVPFPSENNLSAAAHWSHATRFRSILYTISWGTEREHLAAI